MCGDVVRGVEEVDLIGGKVRRQGKGLKSISRIKPFTVHLVISSIDTVSSSGSNLTKYLFLNGEPKSG